ncbi:MAG TPA: transglycosylase domain-containing protein [Gaiellaceae bacterium]|nr:transglycosylase domain-containing protein [Gaiellaceae bacterium]
MTPPRKPQSRPARRSAPPIPTRRRKRRQKRHASRRLLLVGLVAIPVVLVVLGLGGTAVFGSSCDLSSLRPVTAGENSFVYAWDGSLLGAIPAEQNRTAVTRSEISPWVPRATVAIEDRRFYSHGGIDPVGIARAVVADLRARKIVQGGSTITQELVRNLYLSRERTVKRKLVEACLAIKLAHSWSKPKILTAYMNEVYYGAHAYGIEAAAETYFSVPAKDLSIEQAALLAGLPQAPSVYDPFHNAPAALARRDQVLKAMRDGGDITAAEYAHAVHDRSLHLNPGSAYTKIKEPYFFSYVEDLLQQEYGANTVRSGGLQVYTTINPHFQADARTAIVRILGRNDDPAATIVSIDPRSGAIRAMAAVTPGDQQNQFNFATSALRQPGSTFKTIALATAVSQGMDPFSTTYLSAPLHLKGWDVQTYDHTYLGDTTVATATLHSDNTVYARLALDVGPDNIAAMAQKLGVRTKLDTNGYVPPSIALGSVAVTPLDMASAYATLADGGIYSKPMAITKVVLADGKVDTDAGWGKPQQTRVIPDWVASTVTKVLEENMLAGTGVGAHVSGYTDAGKTGTTDKYADAWFSGYTQRLEATVWMGYPKGEIPMLDVHGVAASGPGFPASIWHLYMTSVIGRRKDVPFRATAGTPDFKPWRAKYQYFGGTAPATTTSATTKTHTAHTSTAATTAPPTTAGTPTVTEPTTTTEPETTIVLPTTTLPDVTTTP